MGKIWVCRCGMRNVYNYWKAEQTCADCHRTFSNGELPGSSQDTVDPAPPDTVDDFISDAFTPDPEPDNDGIDFGGGDGGGAGADSEW